MNHANTCLHGKSLSDSCGACEKLYGGMDKSRERIRELEGLLNEALGWLCNHDEEAKDMVLKHKMRGWCCGCSNYLRGEEDVTLVDRIQEALKGAKEPRVAALKDEACDCGCEDESK